MRTIHVDSKPLNPLPPSPMHAILLSIGHELVLGQTVDTNAAELAARLAARGITTRYHQTVPDEREAIADALRQAARTASLVLVTGGLGPTPDDLTREALADAMGVGLETDPASLEALEAFFAARNRPMPARNRTQAAFPAGSKPIPNDAGTAPGIRAKLGASDVFVVPGVPAEMRRMFERSIEPCLDRLEAAPGASGRAIRTTTLHTFGTGESDLAENLGELMDRHRNPTVGTTVAGGLVSIRIRAEAAAAEEAAAMLEAGVRAVAHRAGALLFGRDETTLAEATCEHLAARARTVATAESCTGGLLAAALTGVPGASDVFRGGWVAYANAMKQHALGVDPSLIETHGAVSGPVARALAAGAAERAASDFALSTTGIAGPGGGTPGKPVGTVWIGMAERGRPALALELRLRGDREHIRHRTVLTALQALRLRLMDASLDQLTGTRLETAGVGS